MKKFLGLVAVSLTLASLAFAQALQTPHGVATVQRIGRSVVAPNVAVAAPIKVSTNIDGYVRLDLTIQNTNTSAQAVIWTVNPAGVTNPVAVLGASNVPFRVSYPIVDSLTTYYVSSITLSQTVVISELWGKIQP